MAICKRSVYHPFKPNLKQLRLHERARGFDDVVQRRVSLDITGEAAGRRGEHRAPVRRPLHSLHKLERKRDAADVDSQKKLAAPWTVTTACMPAYLRVAFIDAVRRVYVPTDGAREAAGQRFTGCRSDGVVQSCLRDVAIFPSCIQYNLREGRGGGVNGGVGGRWRGVSFPTGMFV